MLQAIAGLLVIAGAVATWRRVQVNREGQITDRFTRAIDQIGSEKVDVRTGGVYALERIAKNSPIDRTTVQFIIGAFVRNHAPWHVGMPDGPEHPATTIDDKSWLQVRAPDVQAAVSVLARRPIPPEAPRLYLSRVNLRGLHLDRGRAQLPATNFRHTNLARSWLPQAQLDRSDLTSADLCRTNLEEAGLVEAILVGAYLEGTNLRGADLRRADLRGAHLLGSSGRAVAVELTVNEIRHAHNHEHTTLIVVDEIEVRKAGGNYQLSGGELRIWPDWRPEDRHLSPTKFRYDLPDA